MKPSNRSPARGSVGKGGGQWFPEETTYSDASTAVEDPESEWSDENDPWTSVDDEQQSLGERLDMWRRKYLPLPDEVVYEFLGEDEYVVHSDHPSFRAFLEKNIAFVVLIPIIGPVFVWFLLGEINILWTLGIFLLLDLIVAVLALRRLNDRYTSYVITNLRLIKVTGIISRKLVSIPWTRMTGLGYTQKALGRLLGYATIFIESANEESGLREFSDVNDPATFHQRLLDMVSAKSGQSNRPPPAPTVGKRRSFMTKHKERKQAAEAGVAKGFAGGQRIGKAKSEASAGARPKVGGTGESAGRPKVPGSSAASGKAVGSPEPESPEGGRQSSGEKAEPAPDQSAPEAEAEPREPEPVEPDEMTAEGQEPADVPEADGDAGPEPVASDGGGQERQRRGWFRWPGADPGVREPPVPSSADPPEPSAPAGAARRRQADQRRPDQRAPSRRPPETIVVPKAQRTTGQPKKGPKKRTDPRWQGRVREIGGYND